MHGGIPSHLKYIRCLCLSIKVKIRIAVFTVGGAESDMVVYHIWMPIYPYLLVFSAGFQCVCSLELVNG